MGATMTINEHDSTPAPLSQHARQSGQNVQSATADEPATLSTYADLLLQALRVSGRLQLELQLSREQSAGRLEALQVAIRMLGESEKALERARATSQALRDELRRYVAAQMPPGASRAA